MKPGLSRSFAVTFFAGHVEYLVKNLRDGDDLLKWFAVRVNIKYQIIIKP